MAYPKDTGGGLCGVDTDPNTGLPPDDGTEPTPGPGVGRTSKTVTPTYTAPTLPSSTSQADYINALYDAQLTAAQAALKSSYDTNVSTLDQQAATVPATYNTAANQAAATSAVQQAAFNEQAAASGINSGAGSQARLAQNNTLQSNISSIRQAQAQALADLDAQRTALATQYQNAISEAVAANDVNRAQALYEEAQRVGESLVSTAVNQANLNFSVWQALYGG